MAPMAIEVPNKTALRSNGEGEAVALQATDLEPVAARILLQIISWLTAVQQYEGHHQCGHVVFCAVLSSYGRNAARGHVACN